MHDGGIVSANKIRVFTCCQSTIQAYQAYWEFRSSGVQEFRSSGVQEFRSSGVQEFRVAQIAKLQAAKQP
jgi:hypothetical protein